ncbi:alpha/beta hydrolase [Chloroflexota bacterium]
MRCIVVCLLIMFFILPACGTTNSAADPHGTEGSDSIQTDNYANKKLNYFYYIPSTIAANPDHAYPLLVMIPGLSGRGEDFVSRNTKLFADTEGFMIIAPSFTWDEVNWDSNESYQYPSVWSGDALLEIIDQFEAQNDVKVSTLYLLGYSAGAQFALRFCVWKPQLCTACAAHASGGKVFLSEYIDVAFFVTVGKQDQDFRISNFDSFCSKAKNLGIDVECKQYSTGHSISAYQIQDSLDFIARQSVQ